jgi:hypothetical protein
LRFQNPHKNTKWAVSDAGQSTSTMSGCCGLSLPFMPLKCFAIFKKYFPFE